MTGLVSTLGSSTRKQPAIPAGVAIIANADAMADLRKALGTGALGDARLLALACDAPVPDGVLDDTTLLVLEVEHANPASLSRISSLRAARPGLPIIAALHDADVAEVRTIMRLGVVNVVQLPFELAELTTQLEDSLGTAKGKEGERALAPLITVVGSTGGSGTTTVITHLAAELARTSKGARGICVIDLDLQGGEVAYYVGQNPKVTVSALLDAGDRLDPELLRSAVTESGHGFSIIAAPETITALDEVKDENLLRLITLLRQEFDLVLVDLPVDWTGWALSVALASDPVVMVIELSVASLRQAKRRLDLFSSIGLVANRLKLVANRVERKLFRPIDVDAVNEVLGMKVMATLTDEDGRMDAAQNEGQLITDVHRHCKFAADIAELAQALTAMDR